METCETPRKDLMKHALAHYEEISNLACHSSSIVPHAIRLWGVAADFIQALKDRQKVASDWETIARIDRDRDTENYHEGRAEA